MKKLVDKLHTNKILEKNEFVELLNNSTQSVREYAKLLANREREKYYDKEVYIRGLIEISNYCKNNCLYCGIRRDNKNVSRYRMTTEDILKCCRDGYQAGFRTFVLQGGEDAWFDIRKISDIVEKIKSEFSDCAVTLSLGEQTYDTYKKWFDAGTDRYLLRHETADNVHYEKLHPKEMSLEHRKQCLYNLKEIGYQVGAGFMVGSPFQSKENIASDLIFLSELKPHMIGIGPFISHRDTPFADYENGTVEETLFILSIVRLMLPTALIPATTALGSIADNGREQGIMAGANVIMPNLSPMGVRKKYNLYNNKPVSGLETVECLEELNKKIRDIGYKIVISRGDFRKI